MQELLKQDSSISDETQKLMMFLVTFDNRYFTNDDHKMLLHWFTTFKRLLYMEHTVYVVTSIVTIADAIRFLAIAIAT